MIQGDKPNPLQDHHHFNIIDKSKEPKLIENIEKAQIEDLSKKIELPDVSNPKLLTEKKVVQKENLDPNIKQAIGKTPLAKKGGEAEKVEEEKEVDEIVVEVPRIKDVSNYTEVRNEEISTQEQLEQLATEVLKTIKDQLPKGATLKIQSTLDQDQDSNFKFSTFAISDSNPPEIGHQIGCKYTIVAVDAAGHPLNKPLVNVSVKGEIFTNASNPHKALVAASEYKKVVSEFALCAALGDLYKGSLVDKDGKIPSKDELKQMRLRRSFAVEINATPEGTYTGLKSIMPSGEKDYSFSFSKSEKKKEKRYVTDMNGRQVRGADAIKLQAGQNVYSTKEEMLQHAGVTVNDSLKHLDRLGSALPEHLSKLKENYERLKEDIKKYELKFEESQAKMAWLPFLGSKVVETDKLKFALQHDLDLKEINESIDEINKNRNKYMTQDFAEVIKSKLGKYPNEVLGENEFKRLELLIPQASSTPELKQKLDPAAFTPQLKTAIDTLLKDIDTKLNADKSNADQFDEELIRLNGQKETAEKRTHLQQQFINDIGRLKTIEKDLENSKTYLSRLKDEMMTSKHSEQYGELVEDVSSQIDSITNEISQLKEFSAKQLKKFEGVLPTNINNVQAGVWG